MVKVNVSDFLSAQDVGAGVTVEFIDEGKYVESKYGQRFNITVRLKGEEATWTMNKTSQRNLAQDYGDESSQWIGKSAALEVIKMLVQGEMKDVIIGIPAVDSAPVNPTTQTPQERWDE